MSNFFSLPVHELIKQVKDAKLTSVEICQSYIERINKFEKDIKAWAHFDKKLLLEKAEEADNYRKSGKPTGSLHGIPVALKDIIGTYDMPTECGTVLRKGKTQSQNAEIVDLLKSAGAIIMGKTATSELAFLGPPATRNPHDYTRTPGGSSSGSAAVIAAHMAPLSIGSQTGGSVIRPASYCGVVGYKPPYGRNPGGSAVHFDTYAVMGPMTRTVSDAAMMQNILCGPHPLDNASIRPKYVLPDTYEDIQGLRIAWSMDLSFFEVDEHVQTNTLKTLDVLKDLGAELVEVDFGWSAEADRSLQNYLDHLFNGYIKAIVETDPDLATPWATYCANAAGKTSATDFSGAYETQAKMSRHVGAIMDDCYAFICPTSNFQEIPADQDPNDSVVINGKTVDPLYGWSMAHPFNMLGRLPVLSVPSGVGGNGLPTGIQIVARHLDDERVFRVAMALEKEQPWLDCPERRPSI